MVPTTDIAATILADLSTPPEVLEEPTPLTEPEPGLEAKPPVEPEVPVETPAEVPLEAVSEAEAVPEAKDEHWTQKAKVALEVLESLSTPLGFQPTAEDLKAHFVSHSNLLRLQNAYLNPQGPGEFVEILARSPQALERLWLSMPPVLQRINNGAALDRFGEAIFHGAIQTLEGYQGNQAFTQELRDFYGNLAQGLKWYVKQEMPNLARDETKPQTPIQPSSPYPAGFTAEVDATVEGEAVKIFDSWGSGVRDRVPSTILSSLRGAFIDKVGEKMAQNPLIVQELRGAWIRASQDPGTKTSLVETHVRGVKRVAQGLRKEYEDAMVQATQGSRPKAPAPKATKVPAPASAPPISPPAKPTLTKIQGETSRDFIARQIAQDLGL